MSTLTLDRLQSLEDFILGLNAEAAQVTRALFDAARAAPDGRLSELFAGFPREDGTPPVPYPAACHPQGWDAAIPLALAGLLQARRD